MSNVNEDMSDSTRVSSPEFREEPHQPYRSHEVQLLRVYRV